MKYADNKLSEAIAGAQDYVFGKLQRRKTRIEASTIMAYCDDELGWIDVYYMVCDLCPTNQTDESRDAYSVEAVKVNGVFLDKIPSRLEQDILEHLNNTNPAKVKFNN